MISLGIISCDPALGRPVREQLDQHEGWGSAFVQDPQKAQDLWHHTPPKILLWDARDAHARAYQMMQALSQEAKTKPWVLLIDPPEPHWSLEQDWEVLSRPLRLGHLIERLGFYQRLASQPDQSAIKIGPWQFLPDQRLIQDAKHQTIYQKLTDKESALLDYLARAQHPVSKQRILQDVWGYGPQTNTHTLQTHVYRLRSKLMEHPDALDECLIAHDGHYHVSQSWRTK